MPVQAPRRSFTVDEFHQMVEAGILGEDDRVELLAGDIVEMSPIGPRHQGCVDYLTRILSGVLGSEVIVRVQGPLRLDPHSEPQPDVAVLVFRPDYYRQSHPSAADVRLVIEVAETSAHTDREEKLPLYADAGVPEVWIVDLAGRAVEVYRQPGPEGYRQRQRLGPADRLTCPTLPALNLVAGDILA